MTGELLRFPTVGTHPSPSPSLRPAPSFETLDVPSAKQLLLVIQEMMTKAEELLEFVDYRRLDAKSAGIESIAIEICALVEGGRLEAVADTLTESIEKGVDAHVSTSGMDRVRRVERLLSEAAMGMARLPAEKRALSGRAGSRLAQAPVAAAAPSDLSDFLWVPVAFFGLVLVGVVAVAVFAPARGK